LLAITAIGVALAVALGSHGGLTRAAAPGSASTIPEQIGVGLDHPGSIDATDAGGHAASPLGVYGQPGRA